MQRRQCPSNFRMACTPESSSGVPECRSDHVNRQSHTRCPTSYSGSSPKGGVRYINGARAFHKNRCAFREPWDGSGYHPRDSQFTLVRRSEPREWAQPREHHWSRFRRSRSRPSRLASRESARGLDNRKLKWPGSREGTRHYHTVFGAVHRALLHHFGLLRRTLL